LLQGGLGGLASTASLLRLLRNGLGRGDRGIDFPAYRNQCASVGARNTLLQSSEAPKLLLSLLYCWSTRVCGQCTAQTSELVVEFALRTGDLR
jgi:hypothetical protein